MVAAIAVVAAVAAVAASVDASRTAIDRMLDQSLDHLVAGSFVEVVVSELHHRAHRLVAHVLFRWFFAFDVGHYRGHRLKIVVVVVARVLFRWFLAFVVCHHPDWIASRLKSARQQSQRLESQINRSVSLRKYT